jgi:hypothetical protein
MSVNMNFYLTGTANMKVEGTLVSKLTGTTFLWETATTPTGTACVTMPINGDFEEYTFTVTKLIYEGQSNKSLSINISRTSST